MTDIIERLRSQNSYHEDGPPFHVHDPVCTEAADEIERLRSALEAIANQKLSIELSDEHLESADYEGGLDAVVMVARNALKQ